MKNNEAIIYFILESGKKQIYQKDKKGWTQTSTRGITRRMTAEQFLSHLLPALTEKYRNKLIIKVEKKTKPLKSSL